MKSSSPLGTVITAHLQALAKAVWSWHICADCEMDKPCTTTNCSWSRSTVLGPYFEFFKISTYNYTCYLAPGQTPGLACFEDLFKIIEALKSYPKYTKTELLEALFTDRPARPDQERALDLAAQMVMMINCSALRQSSLLLEYGNQQAHWHNEDCYRSFLHDMFPRTAHPNIDEIKDKIRATKLKKHAGLKFQPTNDLRNHLKLDQKAGVVEIFHHAAFLKEQLRFSKEIPPNMSAPDLILEEKLPRAIALEALDSVQKVLFPLADIKSRELLLSFTSTSNCNFDSDMLSPRGFEKWFERRSSPRFVMMATLAGVMLAIFLGLLGLVLAAFQTYVAYMAWKHPIQPSLGP